MSLPACLDDIDTLSPATQDDIIQNLREMVPRLAEEDDDTVRGAIFGLVESPPVAIRRVDPKRLHAQFEEQHRGVSAIAVAKLATKLDYLKDLDPVLISGKKFVDGGHRVTAYIERGRATIPAVDITALLKMDWDAYLGGEDVPWPSRVCKRE